MIGMWSQQLNLPSGSLPLQIGAQQLQPRAFQAQAAGWRSSTGRPTAELPLGSPVWRSVGVQFRQRGPAVPSPAP